MITDNLCKCKTCGADIRFLKTKLGKFLPVEPDMHDWAEDSKGKLFRDTGDIIWKPALGEGGYLSHWENCPGRYHSEDHVKTADKIEKEKQDAPNTPLDREENIPKRPVRSWLGNR